MKRWCVVIGWVVLVLLLWNKAGLTAAYAEERSKKAVSTQAKEKQAKEQQAKEKQAKEQQAKEQQAKEQQAREQQAREQQAKEQQAKEQQAREQQAREEQAREQQAREQADREQIAKDAKRVPIGEDSWVELEVRGWAPSLRGTVQSSSTGITGTNLSLGDTLGMDTSRQFVWPKATLHFAKNHRIWASYLDMQYAGDKTLTQDITFGGSTFTAAESVHSEMDFREIAGGYQYDWLKFSKFSSNLNLQVHYLNIEARLRSNVVSTVTESIKVPIPTIGVGMQVWPVDWLKLHGDFNIFKLGGAGFKGEMIDSQAALTVSPWEWLGASVGYRYYRVIANDTESGDHADWLQHGPYVSVMVRF